MSKFNSVEERKKIGYQLVGLEHSTLIKAFETCDQEIEKLAVFYPDILIVDTSSMTGRKDFFLDHVHTTELGSEKLATIVAEELNPVVSKFQNSK